MIFFKVKVYDEWWLKRFAIPQETKTILVGFFVIFGINGQL